MTTKDTSMSKSKSLSKKNESLYILQRIKLLNTEFFCSILCHICPACGYLRTIFLNSEMYSGPCPVFVMEFFAKIAVNCWLFSQKARVFIDINQGPKCVSVNLDLKFDNWKKPEKKHSVFADFHAVMISYSR